MRDLREHYTRGELSERNTPACPLSLFRSWFEDAVAAGIPDANAMSLATASASGQPSARMVLLKDLTDGFTFFTNYESRKGEELAANPKAALLFFWAELERQVRIEGVVNQCTRTAAEEYFATRPEGSRLGAWASPQSRSIPGRSVLEEEYAKRAREFGAAIPCPPHWGGFLLVPHRIEFWQGRQDRLHDRILYTRTDRGWKKERLAP